jgi:hypothetical protein
MRIFSSKGRTPMLLDSRDRLARLHELNAFLASAETHCSIAARCDGDPAPYERFLPGIRVQSRREPSCCGKTPMAGSIPPGQWTT